MKSKGTSGAFMKSKGTSGAFMKLRVLVELWWDEV